MVENIGEIFDGKKYTDEEVEDLLFGKIIKQERDKVTKIFSDEDFVDYQDGFWNSAANTMTKNRELPNLSIYLNNKMVEVLNYFRDKDIPFYQEIQKTSLAKLIMEKIFSMYNEGFNYLKNVIYAIERTEGIDDEKMGIKDFRDLYVSLNDYLINMVKYQKIADKQLWKYDIEKNIVGTIFEEFLNCEDKRKYITKLKIYLEDLKRLRFKSSN